MTEVKTAEEFRKIVSDTDKLVVVDFTATWCPPCRAIAPFVHELQGKYPDVVFLKVDVDKEIASEHRVRAMPTFEFIKEKQVLHRFEGAMQEALVYWVEQLKDKKNVNPADLAGMIEKAPELSIGTMLKRSAKMLLLPIVIIGLMFLWSGLTIFIRKFDSHKQWSWLPSGLSVVALYIVLKALNLRRQSTGDGITQLADKTIIHDSKKDD